MTHREDVIRQLLERYAEFTDPLNGPAGAPGDGDGLALMPRTYTASVRELERLLCTMRQDRHRALLTLASGEKVSVRSCWWHVTERYLRCSTRQRSVRWLRGQWVDLRPNEHVIGKPGGWELTLADGRTRKKATPTEFVVVVQTWDAAVRSKLVDRGVEWLASEWALAHEPMLPLEAIAA